MTTTEPATEAVSAHTEPKGLLDRLARIATGIAALSLIGMAITQAWQVLARYVLNDAPAWTEPLTLTLLACTLSFGAAASVHDRAHFAFPLLVARMPATVRPWFARFSAFVTITVGLLLAFGAARLALDQFDIRLAGTILPQAAPFVPLVFGGALMAVFAFPQLLHPPRENT